MDNSSDEYEDDLVEMMKEAAKEQVDQDQVRDEDMEETEASEGGKS